MPEAITPTPCVAAPEELDETFALFSFVAPDVNLSPRNQLLDLGQVVARIHNADVIERTVIFGAGNIASAGGAPLTVTVAAEDVVYVGPFEPARFTYEDVDQTGIRAMVGEADDTSPVAIEFVQMQQLVSSVAIDEFTSASV